MAVSEPDILTSEARLARRVERLFRVDRRGILGRHGAELAERMRARRAALIDALIRADDLRRSLRIPVSAQLEQAAQSLWRETSETQRSAELLLERLNAELAMTRGDGCPSGIRDSTAGRVIARG